MVCGLFAEDICKSILNVCYENCLPKVYRIVTSRIQFSPTLECYAFVSVSRCLTLQYRAWLTGRGSIKFSESFSVSIFWTNIRLWPITRLKSLPVSDFWSAFGEIEQFQSQPLIKDFCNFFRVINMPAIKMHQLQFKIEDVVEYERGHQSETKAFKRGNHSKWGTKVI